MEDLSELLDYHYWARDRILDAAEPLASDDYVRDLHSSYGSLRDTLVHTYSAEWIWCCRWEGEAPAAMLDSTGFPDVPGLRQAWAQHEVKLRALFDRFFRTGLDQAIEYRDMSGRAWRHPFDVLFRHVVNHGSYHRGQATTLLRQLKAAPPKSMDLITYYRERE
jgi:uncharacterized damage-inducible protein DinB